MQCVVNIKPYQSSSCWHLTDTILLDWRVEVIRGLTGDGIASAENLFRNCWVGRAALEVSPSKRAKFMLESGYTLSSFRVYVLHRLGWSNLGLLNE